MNVWELLAGASSLPIDPANNLWNHINNLNAGGASVVYGEIMVTLVADLNVEIESDLKAEIEKDFEVSMEKEFEVEVCS